jgi:hypothetical protein
VRHAGKRGRPIVRKTSSPNSGWKKISSNQPVAAAGLRRNGTTISAPIRTIHSST